LFSEGIGQKEGKIEEKPEVRSGGEKKP